MKRMILCGMMVIGCVYAGALAQSPPAAKPAPKAAKTTPDDPIARLLQSADAVQARDALAQIRQAIADDPKKSLPLFSRTWGEGLLKAGLNEDLAALCLSAIVEHPDMAGIEPLALLRTKALLAGSTASSPPSGGKGQEALKAAKSYYNVAALDKTKDAVDLVIAALKVAHPDKPELIFRFKQQQLYNAMATPPTTRPDLGEDILAWIPAEGQVYAGAIEYMLNQRRTLLSLKALGMLQLLADDNQAALATFEQAYPLAGSDRQLPDVTANLARAMKARDRGIGQANAWAASIRPKE